MNNCTVKGCQRKTYGAGDGTLCKIHYDVRQSVLRNPEFVASIAPSVDTVDGDPIDLGGETLEAEPSGVVLRLTTVVDSTPDERKAEFLHVMRHLLSRYAATDNPVYLYDMSLLVEEALARAAQ